MCPPHPHRIPVGLWAPDVRTDISNSGEGATHSPSWTPEGCPFLMGTEVPLGLALVLCAGVKTSGLRLGPGRSGGCWVAQCEWKTGPVGVGAEGAGLHVPEGKFRR